MKKDAYNQTIKSDSSSLLQIRTSLNGSFSTDAGVSVLGNTFVQLEQGVAIFSVQLKPSYSSVLCKSGVTVLQTNPFIYFDGQDAKSSSTVLMQSRALPMALSGGFEVCPLGYVLVFDSSGIPKGPAQCQRCPAGTYSVSPLAGRGGLSDSSIPACLNCPAGGKCIDGGSDFAHALGDWKLDDDQYRLINCPAGTQLINSTNGDFRGTYSHDSQQCKQCLSTEYIINPNTDSCQICPPGLQCSGDDALKPVTANSTWVRNGSVYRLRSCPSGYGVSSVGVSGTFDASVQQCSPCPKGEECVSPPCVACSVCLPGFYKPTATADPCTPCPADSYNPVHGGQELAACVPCRTKATTRGAMAQSTPSSCICDAEYYPAATAASTCTTCPRGATCADRSCTLWHSPPLVNCTDGQRIVGTWALQNTTGKYALTSCPAGYSTRTAAKTLSEDLEECQACGVGQYILRQDTDDCQTCPPGLVCRGSDVVQARVPNSTWVKNGSSYLLTSCPAGYSVLVLSLGAQGLFDASVQQCSPCPKGEECVSLPCVACSACLPSFYKPTATADPCTPCPAHQYSTIHGGQDLSVCQLCPQGAVCSDGSCALRNAPTLSCPGEAGVVGSWRLDNISGQFSLVACPAGYIQEPAQCLLCPATFYCSAGLSTPCASYQFSLPGSSSRAICFPSVFVVAVINLPMSRPFFEQTAAFQTALASLVTVDSVYVLVQVVQAGVDASTTDVTSEIATLNASSADALSKRLWSLQTSGAVGLGFQSMGARFNGASLSSVKLTACVPGYSLQSQPPPSTCQICHANSYCPGGASSSALCSQGTFSDAGANSSSSCKQYAVSVVVSLSISKANFTAALESSFVAAIALAVGVSPARVSILSTTQVTGRREASAALLQVSSQISADTASAAAVLSGSVDPKNLDQYLVAAGLPPTESVSVTVQSSVAQASGSQLMSESVIVGASVGGFAFVLLVLSAGYVSLVTITSLRAHRKFVATITRARPGETASQESLAQDLRKHYTAERVLGKGAFGCVVKARKNGSDQYVAIKIALPEKGAFDETQMRRLRREADVHELFMSRKCEYAVHLAGSTGSVEIRAEVCWFILEYLDGEDMHNVIHVGCRKPSQTGGAADGGQSVEDTECIKVARSVLAALKVMHAEGLNHKDVKPANIVRSRQPDGKSAIHKLIDFGSAIGVDESVAKEAMMTLLGNRAVAVGTPPYMSPEMFKEPERASYPTDIWSLGVTMYELVTSRLPFQSDSDLLWNFAVAGNMDEKAPDVLDALPEGRRSTFDNNLGKVIAKALEKRVGRRYDSADEMHEAVYACLIERGEACYSGFISYRVASEAPLARFLFDELNHSVTPGGHRVTVYWDAHRLVKGEDWETGFASGLLNSLCFLPLLSYGFTAPLASLPEEQLASALALGWEMAPVGRQRLEGVESDPEDNCLKELLIAQALLGPGNLQAGACGGESAQLQFEYPILAGRQEPDGHPEYPRMGSFFAVQGGGGSFVETPSPPTARAVFLRDRAGFTTEAAELVKRLRVQDVMTATMRRQGCQLWNHPKVLL